MSSRAQEIVDSVTEKRRLNSDYNLSMVELKAVDEVLIAQARVRLFTFTLTEVQRRALSFAALCEAEDLQAGKEAYLTEVQEVIASLWEARRILEEVPA